MTIGPLPRFIPPSRHLFFSPCRLVGRIFVLGGALLLCVQRCPGQDFHVNSVADKVDSSPGDGICSSGSLIDGKTPECTLRAAVDEVNALSQQKPGTSYTVSVGGGTYFLTTVETCPYHDVGNPNLLSRNAITLCISGNLTLTGDDPSTTIIDGGLLDRIFFVSAGATAAINNVTIQHGTFDPGSFDGGGGGINNQGALTVTNDLFTANNANIGGGGIFNSGTLIVEGCTFTGNNGSGLTANYATLTSINHSYFTQNYANQGAAVETFVGTLQISNSTFTGNTTNTNAIIGAYNTAATITNSTISNNTVANAGTVVSAGNGSSLVLNNDTISGNSAGNTIAGVFGDTVTISNTILAGNLGADCVVNNLTNLGHNIIQNADFVALCKGGNDATTLTGVDAGLGSLSGNLPSLVPLPGSPAIGAGSPRTPGNGVPGTCTALDQHGVVRGGKRPCTIGAVEPADGLQIADLVPNRAGMGGAATVVVHGSGFVPGTTVALQRSGGPALTPSQTIVSPDTTSISVLLDLSAATAGSYDVVVATPGSGTTALTGGFTVEDPVAPEIYSYFYGNTQAHAGRPAYYSVVYGNRGNVDAYLVPLTLSLPASGGAAISSILLSPPAASSQAIHDWTYVPLEVSPYSTAGFTNVPLLIPVVPARSQGVLMFTITPSSSAAEGSAYTFYAGVGDPYGSGPGGSVAADTVSQLVNGAQQYAQSSLGTTLSPQALAHMSTYATAQLAQEVSIGQQALLLSAGGQPVFFSTAQLSIDIASYGASLAGNPAASAEALRPPQRLAPLRVHPQDGSGSSGGLAPCHKGDVLAVGQSCDANATPVPTKEPPPPADGKVDRPTCQAMPGHHISQDGTACVPDNPQGCPLMTNTVFNDPKCGSYPIRGSVDPNEKDGPLGIGDAHFTLAADPFQYQIEFENAPAATAPAQTVTVTDTLDASKFDLSTFALGSVSFGHYLLTPSPGVSTFTGALDLRPDNDVIVAIQASLNQTTGVITWNFTSLDPSTMQLTTDPIAGFLPPDTIPGAGIGHVAFTVHPVVTLASGAQACNSASIVFDTNPAIATAPFCNSKDTAPPASSVQPLSANISTPQFPVSWSGTDAGVGIATYTIYVSDNGGAFQPWQRAVSTTSATFSGQQGHAYAFYSTAVDQLGNAEAKTAPDTTTKVGTSAPAPQAALAPAALSFGSITVPATATGSLTLSNPGDAALAITSVTITGLNASVFHLSANTCGSSLAANSSCTLSVAFTPTTAGDSTASIAVLDSVGTQTAALTGTAAIPPAPHAALTPPAVSFGSAAVGTTSPAQTLTLSNPGSVVLAITSITLAGANSSSFAIMTNTCGPSLAAGASCSINITFSPGSTGDLAATLSVADAAGMQLSTLSGSGTAPPTPVDFTITATPATQSTAAGSTVVYTVQVAPTSVGPFANSVALSASGAPQGASIVFAPASVTPGANTASSTMTVVLAPTSSANRRFPPPYAPRGLPAGISLGALVVGLLVRGRDPSSMLRLKTRPLDLLVLGMLFLGSFAAITGCGGGDGGMKSSSISTIVITGTSGSIAHQTSVTLTIEGTSR